jgi:hypothetical protein
VITVLCTAFVLVPYRRPTHDDSVGPTGRARTMARVSA